MADLKELADEVAKALLKAIRDQAPKANDSKLLNLAQAYSLVVSAEVTAELVDDDETLDAEKG
jgi:aminoglycoside phosphotransferase family enzyme